MQHSDSGTDDQSGIKKEHSERGLSTLREARE